MDNNAPSLTKWPFVVQNVMLVGLTLWILNKFLPPQNNWERALVGLCLLVGAWAAWLHCKAWLQEYETKAQLQENAQLKSAVEQIAQLTEVGKLVADATSRWQAAQEASAATVQSGREVSQQMGREVVEFQQFLQQSQHTQIDHLNLEIEKLRRGEREWLQTIALILDHTHALHQAALRSGQPQVCAQLNTFQAACQDALRRVGVGVYVPEVGIGFDERTLAMMDGSPQAEPGFVVQGVAAPGISFQGQLLRKALVVLGPSQIPEPAPVAATASSFDTFEAAQPTSVMNIATVTVTSTTETSELAELEPAEKLEESESSQKLDSTETAATESDAPPWATPTSATEEQKPEPPATGQSVIDAPSPSRKRKTTPQTDLPF